MRLFDKARWLAWLLLAPRALTQQQAAPAASFGGCVASVPSAPGAYVLAGDKACYLLDSPKAASLLGHEVVLKAVLIPQQGPHPITLQVKSVIAVRGACSQTCTLQPPGTRGLGPKDKPGREGGPPGVTNNPQPQP